MVLLISKSGGTTDPAVSLSVWFVEFTRPRCPRYDFFMCAFSVGPMVFKADWRPPSGPPYIFKFSSYTLCYDKCFRPLSNTPFCKTRDNKMVKFFFATRSFLTASSSSSPNLLEKLAVFPPSPPPRPIWTQTPIRSLSSQFPFFNPFLSWPAHGLPIASS